MVSHDLESPVLKALRLPDILSRILLLLQNDYLHHDDRTLLACIFVNSLWSEETSRLIWEFCGIDSTDDPWPQLKYLARIYPDRRQKYANYIRHLTIQDQPGPDGQTIWDGAWLTELEHYSFPRLEALDVVAPAGHREEDNYQWLPLRQFAQPSLRHLTLVLSNSAPFLVAEEFLQKLQQSSTGLRSIYIQQQSESPLDDELQMAPDRLASFLEAFRSLDHLSWLLEGPMSSLSMQVLSKLPKLKILDIKHFHVEWADRLSEPTFGALESLQCQKMPGPSLRALAPFICRISELSISEPVNSQGLWKAFVDIEFKHLRSLNIRLRKKTVLHGSEIMHLASSSPNLQTLEIGSTGLVFKAPDMWLQDFNDETLIQVGEKLPQLQVLEIGAEVYGNSLTEKPFIDLARLCPLLRNYHMCMRIDWTRLVALASASDTEWPNLTNVNILDHHDNDAEMFSKHDAEKIAQQLQERMPRIMNFTIFPMRGKVSHELVLAVRSIRSRP